MIVFFWPECQGAYFRLNHFSQQNWHLATKSVDFFHFSTIGRIPRRTFFILIEADKNKKRQLRWNRTNFDSNLLLTSEIIIYAIFWFHFSSQKKTKKVKNIFIFKILASCIFFILSWFERRNFFEEFFFLKFNSSPQNVTCSPNCFKQMLRSKRNARVCPTNRRIPTDIFRFVTIQGIASVNGQTGRDVGEFYKSY